MASTPMRPLPAAALLLAMALAVACGHAKALVPVCVTGASGYLASDLTAQLLASGQYDVRATVRSLSNDVKVAPLRALPGAAERLQLFEADLFSRRSFEGCMAGAHFVFHTASPFITKNIQNATAQLVEPAVTGTRNVMHAAAAAGTVRRVVMTSSVAAVMAGFTKGQPCLTEENWNTASRIDGNGLDQYRLSKTLAERAAWDFIEAQQDPNPMQLATINPSFITGPPVTPRIDSESLENMAAILRGEVPPRGPTPVVDVRDVSLAHMLAATTPAAAGQRFIMSVPSPVSPSDVLRAVNSAAPHVHTVVPTQPPAEDPPVVFCSKTVGSILGMKLTPPEESLADMAVAMLQLNSVQPKLRNAREL